MHNPIIYDNYLNLVVSMFRDQPMQQILTATRFCYLLDRIFNCLCAALSLASEVSSSSYEHYKYLKSLSNLLCSLGVHLAEIWSYIMKTPPNFSLYLSALAAFFVHPSLVRFLNPFFTALNMGGNATIFLRVYHVFLYRKK